MKHIFNQIETMGLTTIKEFTGINAENEPHAAFMQMLCNYRLADKEEVMFLTGLSSNGYERVFQENPQIGMRELKLDSSAILFLLCAQNSEESLPQQERFCHLLLKAMLDFVEEAKTEEGYHPTVIPMDNVLNLEKLFLAESSGTFAKMLNDAIIVTGLYFKYREIEEEA